MNVEDVKVWLYRLQQRLAITRSEATALLALGALLLAGLVARHVQSAPQAVPGSDFAATDHRFQEGAARLRAAEGEAARAERAERATEQPTPAPSESAPMNVNAASPAALERLPGVGPVIAGRIAAYRDTHGPFAEVEHLERVSGIGPKTMAQLAPLLSAGAATDDTTRQTATPTP